MHEYVIFCMVKKKKHPSHWYIYIYTQLKDYNLFNFSLMQLTNHPITWELLQCI